jgi:hypothetical protein
MQFHRTEILHWTVCVDSVCALPVCCLQQRPGWIVQPSQQDGVECLKGCSLTHTMFPHPLLPPPPLFHKRKGMGDHPPTN